MTIEKNEIAKKMQSVCKKIVDYVRETAVNTQDEKKHTCFAVGVCLLSAIVCLTICSQSSFLYPINSWVDSNCFFTVGKAMMNGKVVYRDIYEQKGILLYFVHGICWLISNDTFIGVFFVELLASFFFLFYSYKTLRLYCGRTALFAIPVLSALIYSSYSFVIGDSAEELCLPFFSYGLYVSLNALQKKKPVSFRQSIIIGITSGAVLWTKFTMLGFYIGGAIVPLMMLLINKKFKKFFSTCLGIVLGVVTITMPFFIYFAVNGALGDWFKVYFYNNMFLYSGNKMNFLQSVRFTFSAASWNIPLNKRFSYLIIIGVIYALLFFRVSEKLHLILTLLFTNIFIYIGGNAYLYYYFAESAFALFGIIIFVRLFELLAGLIKKEPAKVLKNFLQVTVVLCLLVGSGFFSYNKSMNVHMMGVEKESLPQYRFANIINKKDNAKLLNYYWLDGGFYTAANIVPDCKFFCRLNMTGLPEMDETQNKWLDDGIPDFVVTCGFPLYHKNYKVIDKCSMINFFSDTETYYLAQRIEKIGDQKNAEE